MTRKRAHPAGQQRNRQIGAEADHLGGRRIGPQGQRGGLRRIRRERARVTAGRDLAQAGGRGVQPVHTQRTAGDLGERGRLRCQQQARCAEQLQRTTDQLADTPQPARQAGLRLQRLAGQHRRQLHGGQDDLQAFVDEGRSRARAKAHARPHAPGMRQSPQIQVRRPRGAASLKSLAAVSRLSAPHQPEHHRQRGDFDRQQHPLHAADRGLGHCLEQRAGQRQG